MAQSPRIYGLPKLHKEGIPLRPICSSTGSPAHSLCKYVADILKNITANSEYNIKNRAEAERRECEELELLATRNNARKFYQKIRRQTEGFKTEENSCKNENGDLVTDVRKVLSLWREDFSALLNGENDLPYRDDEPDAAIDDDGINVPPSDYDEVRIAITRLINNKAAGAGGLPAELFKYGGEELVRRMPQLLRKIWADECMPDDWNLCIPCPVHKKGDTANC
ncbi:uncharacterized protein, partial [Eurosta solidaginis]|uniref:uncharacterized protein n=1 Tax=Eurosta solidaginis TaxID=178769 RepID=UPI003530B54C